MSWKCVHRWRKVRGSKPSNYQCAKCGKVVVWDRQVRVWVDARPGMQELFERSLVEKKGVFKQRRKVEKIVKLVNRKIANAHRVSTPRPKKHRVHRPSFSRPVVVHRIKISGG